MRVSAVRVGGAAVALALVAIGFALHATWLAVLAVLVVLATIAFTVA